MTTLFVSDIHLTGLQPAITAQFAAFLRGEARQARQLYILGDLFEFWVGDDDPDPTYLQIQSELRALTQAGVACYVMHGNRDFLLGKTFCANTGCQLIADGTVIELFGQRIVLCHGDILCTDDVSYQRLRRIVRNPVIQTICYAFCLSSSVNAWPVACGWAVRNTRNRLRKASWMSTSRLLHATCRMRRFDG